MAVATDEILDVLRERGVDPLEGDVDLPSIGEVEEGETIYSTSIAQVFPKGGDEERPEPGLPWDDDRMNGWWQEIERILERQDEFPKIRA